MNPYLSFVNGGCKPAFDLYQAVFGATCVFAHTYADSPMAEHAPDGDASRIMHATLRFPDGALLMGADMSEAHARPFGGFSLSVNAPTPEDAERWFNGISAGGQVTMPLEKTFWAERFGMCIDRFGVPWMISVEHGKEA